MFTQEQLCNLLQDALDALSILNENIPLLKEDQVWTDVIEQRINIVLKQLKENCND